MRLAFALATVTLGIAGISAASAADVPRDNLSGYSTHYSAHGHRAGQFWIYDFQPGVIVRAYWRAPWRNRHYYPTTGEKPDSGRLEDLSPGAGAPEPAETFQRSWSTSSAFIPELRRDLDLPPPIDQIPVPLK
jgi:hypothetical protein